MNANKHDSKKPRMDLLPPRAMLAVGEILTYGADKYDPHNWTKGLAYSRLQSAALRHLMAWQSGEDNDPESGYSHLAHAACSIMMLLETTYIYPGHELDDRCAAYRRPQDEPGQMGH